MRICVTGDRNWSDIDRVRRVFDRVEEFVILSGFSVGSIELIHGDCRGLDKIAAQIAAQIATEKGWKVISVPVTSAEWKKYGKVAGPLRNRRMLDLNPEVVIWFHDNLAESRGTADMIRASNERGVTVVKGS